MSVDARAGVTDTDGDQVIFRYVGTGVIQSPLLDPTVGGDPGNPPFQVFGNGIVGPWSGTYEVVAATGKYIVAFPLARTYDVRWVMGNPANPPTPGGSLGSAFVEVLQAK